MLRRRPVRRSQFDPVPGPARTSESALTARFSALASDCWTSAAAAAILMGGLHVTVTAADYFAGDLIGYTTGLLVTVLLLVLTLRAAKLPGTPLANIGFAACALLWTAGGLASALMATLAPRGSRGALVTEAIQYSGGAFLP